MTKVLVTCAGSGVGQSVIDSLNQLTEYYLIGIDTNPIVYANHFCNDFFISPSIYSDDYIDFLIETSLKNNVDIIIPGHDHELLLLSKEIQKFNEVNIKVLVSEPSLIEISRDKYLWYDYFKQKNCPVVPTQRVSEFKRNPDKSLFPAIIKPAGGSASQGISIINKLSELTNMNDDDIIQPYLFPETTDPNYNTIIDFVQKGKFVQMSEISIQLIFNKNSEFESIFISKNSLKNGVPVSVEPINPDSFEYIDDIMSFVPVCIESQVIGPVNIQGRITDKGLVCFEMNMRFTGITGNRSLLGFNEVSFLVNNFLDKESKINGYALNKVGVRQVACTTIPAQIIDESSQKIYTILGTGGYIGSEFLYQLLETKNYHQINIICRASSIESYKKRFNDKNISIYTDTDLITQTIYCQTDILVNFVGALAYESDEKKFAAILFQHSQVQKIIKANIPLVLNISSQSIYDQKSDTNKSEDSTVKIDNSYAFQKYISEQFFNSIESFSPSCKSISLRLSRVIGLDHTKELPKGFFIKIIQSLLNNEEIQIPSPENKTNLINIKDVAAAILFICNSNNYKSYPSTLNLGGENLSMKEYCTLVANTLNKPESIKLVKFGNNQDIDQSSMIDCSQIDALGWESQYSLKATIEEIEELLTK